ncbi:MAG: hypothetical protein AAGF73_05330 [Actinomycetota bacterium]
MAGSTQRLASSLCCVDRRSRIGSARQATFCDGGDETLLTLLRADLVDNNGSTAGINDDGYRSMADTETR